MEKSEIIRSDYNTLLKQLGNVKYDLIFIDPPYAQDIAVASIKKILEFDLLSEEGIIILETDEDIREIEELKQLNINICDLRKYGRVKLIFLNRKG